VSRYRVGFPLACATISRPSVQDPTPPEQQRHSIQTFYRPPPKMATVRTTLGYLKPTTQIVLLPVRFADNTTTSWLGTTDFRNHQGLHRPKIARTRVTFGNWWLPGQFNGVVAGCRTQRADSSHSFSHPRLLWVKSSDGFPGAGNRARFPALRLVLDRRRKAAHLQNRSALRLLVAILLPPQQPVGLAKTKRCEAMVVTRPELRICPANMSVNSRRLPITWPNHRRSRGKWRPVS